MASRPLPVLLQLIDAEPDEPFIMERVATAVQASVITNAEARHLQSFESRTPKSRKRALAAAADARPEAVDEMRAKLKGLRAELGERCPAQGWDHVP